MASEPSMSAVTMEATSLLEDRSSRKPHTPFETTRCLPCTPSSANLLPLLCPSQKAPRSTSYSTTPSRRTLSTSRRLLLLDLPRRHLSPTRLRQRPLRRRTSTRYTTSRTHPYSTDPHTQLRLSAAPARDPPHCTSYPAPRPDDSVPWAPPTLLLPPILMTLPQLRLLSPTDTLSHPRSLWTDLPPSAMLPPLSTALSRRLLPCLRPARDL